MALVRMTMEEIRRDGGQVDYDRVNNTTEEEMDRHAIEDDAVLAEHEGYPTPGTVRARFGLSQEAMAEMFNIPVGTWRNWEQNRTRLDPSAKTLLRILFRQPEAARRAMAPVDD